MPHIRRSSARRSRHGDEPSDDARQGALHSRNDDDDFGARELIPGREEAMEPGDPDVRQAIHRMPKGLGHDGGLLRDRQIAGTGAHDEDAGQCCDDRVIR